MDVVSMYLTMAWNFVAGLINGVVAVGIIAVLVAAIGIWKEGTGVGTFFLGLAFLMWGVIGIWALMS